MGFAFDVGGQRRCAGLRQIVYIYFAGVNAFQYGGTHRLTFFQATEQAANF